MIAVGTKVRTLYEYPETGTIQRKSKTQHEANVRYFGSEEKASLWYRFKPDGGRKVCLIHRDMLAISNA